MSFSMLRAIRQGKVCVRLLSLVVQPNNGVTLITVTAKEAYKPISIVSICPTCIAIRCNELLMNVCLLLCFLLKYICIFSHNFEI